MSGSLLLADGGQSGLGEALGAIVWMFGAGAFLVGMLLLVVVGIRRLFGLE
jgi:hypothetical protein